jgi:hypothetical protein
MITFLRYFPYSTVFDYLGNARTHFVSLEVEALGVLVLFRHPLGRLPRGLFEKLLVVFLHVAVSALLQAWKKKRMEVIEQLRSQELQFGNNFPFT